MPSFSLDQWPRCDWSWLRYVEARRGGGHNRAVSVNNLPQTTADEFAHRYEKHPADIINGKKVWCGWQKGIETTGLNYMIEAADQLSNDVFFPPMSEQ